MHRWIVGATGDYSQELQVIMPYVVGSIIYEQQTHGKISAILNMLDLKGLLTYA